LKPGEVEHPQVGAVFVTGRTALVMTFLLVCLVQLPATAGTATL
jgi:hypothetical protein